MTLLTPTALVLLAAIPILVLIHTLRLRRTPTVVSSVLLWKLAHWEGSGNRFTRTISDWLPLLLQVLVAALLAFALARPALLRSSHGSGVEVFVVDVSASMAARDGGQRRIEATADAIRTRLRDMRPDARVALIAAGPPDRVLSPLARERAPLLRALGTLEPMAVEGDLAGALGLAAGMLRNRPGSMVHLFTDRAFDEDPLAAHPGLPVEVHANATAEGNVGIVTFEARRDRSSPLDWQVLIELLNASPRDREVEATLDLDGVLMDVRRFTIPAGRRYGQVLRDVPLGPGVVTLTLSGRDALETDDSARLVIERDGRRVIAVIGETHPALERALDANPNLTVHRVSPAALDSRGQLSEAVHVTVLSRWRGEQRLMGPQLWIEPPLTGPTTSMTPAHGAVTWRSDHPVTRLLDLSDLSVSELGWPALPTELEPIAWVGRQPILLAGRPPSGRMVVLKLDLSKTNLPQRVSFPVLITSALRWLGEASDAQTRHAYRAGQALDLSDAHGDISVEDPRGRRHEVSSTGPTPVFGNTFEAGLYRVRWDGGATLAAVNLGSALESDLTPRWRAPRSPSLSTDELGEPYHQEFAWILVALALGVGALEWWLYRRREAW